MHRTRFLLVVAVALVAAVSLGQDNLLANLRARELGPTSMGGRVSDIAVYEKDPRIFYVATASGGLWKTENAGLTFAPVWDKGTTVALGAVDVSQSDPNLVWIGTGEQNARNSVSWGDGVYKSTDGGKTWEHMGLKETRHIAQVIIDPKDNNVVYVAACGRLWGKNPERGVFKTTDGGKTWEHVLRIDESTGVNDLAMDPSNNKVLLAGAYQRIRYPWNYVSGGPGSGLYKTTDAGKTWRKITKGLPEGTIGRIGLDFFRKDPRKVVMQIEAAIMPQDPAQRPTPTGGVFVSEDRGESWKKVNNRNNRPFYYSTPKWDPVDENRIYIPDTNLGFSDDKGVTIRNMRTSVHVDHHALWVNPNNNNHIIIGQDGGLAQTHDRGQTWQFLNTLPIGQFYAIAFDMRKPYYVYGGLQDNGSWGGPTQGRRNAVAFWDWYLISGGDGFYVQVDPTDWSVIYTESQGGAAGRTDQKTGARRNIRPPVGQGNARRFNWNTPIHLSPHNPSIVYIGAHRLYRSLNRGDSWEAISPDLTTNNPDKMRVGLGSVTPEATGAENHCTIVTISESPVRAGVIWCGTDDGLVHVTRDHGVTWTNVTANIPGAPKDGWVSRVQASKWVEGRAYVTFDNHRLDDLSPYVYVTEDFGATWAAITSGVRAEEPCHVVREGLVNRDLLILGTEYGIYFSLNRGQSWTRFASNFPTVPVHDLAIHPRELDLVIGTHGRSIWTVNISGLEALSASELEKDVVLAKPQNIYLLGRMNEGMGFDGDGIWMAPNTQPGTEIHYYLKSDVTEDVTIEILDAAGTRVANLQGSKSAGLNVVPFSQRPRPRIAAGDYTVKLKVGAKEYVTSLRVEDLTEAIHR